jgi:hypothetical protein
MEQPGLKETAESVLRELPSVVGAFVQPDAFGRPREIHLLIEPGPRPKDFAEQVKSVLENRLRIPIDQRIISIAQLADQPAREQVTESGDAKPGSEAGAVAPWLDRVRLVAVDNEVSGTQVTVEVRLSCGSEEAVGQATELDAEGGRARAGAAATLDAANQLAGEEGRFILDFATTVGALGKSYVLVSAVVASRHLGRRSVPVAGAHTVEEGPEAAAALATLKAVNRLLQFVRGRPARRAR